MGDGPDTPAPVSFAALALWVSGAGVLALGLTALAVALLPLPPAGRAVVAVVGIIAAIAAMGVVSSRITDRAIRAEYGDAPRSGSDIARAEADGEGRSEDGLG